MSTLGQRPDAIVIGSGLNALGVIRSLGQGGLRVASISRSEHDPPQLSRFTSVRVQAPAAGTALLEAVRVLVAEAGPPVVVFLTEEETVQFLADTNQNLHSKAICRLPTPRSCDHCSTSRSLTRSVTSTGFRCPGPSLAGQTARFSSPMTCSFR